MPSRSSTLLPRHLFVPPGAVNISSSALDLARRFGEHVKKTRPDESWVIAFDWADERRVRLPDSNRWEELGAGLDLGAYDRVDLPEGVTQTIDHVEFVVTIPRQVFERATERVIDMDDAAPAKLVLK